MKTLFRLLAALFCTLGLQVQAGNLKVDLSPTAAVSAGAQWRVDGGAWRNSGSTASGLSNTTHTVDFKTVSGWIAPASTSVSISGGTTTATGTYVQPAGMKITLTPSSGQWRIDGGTWRASAATVSGLTPGNHTVDYAAVAGFAAPASETVSLTAGQTANFSRSYTPLAQLKITLSPTSAQWRVDGGAWQASGATVSNLTPGSHAVSYSAVTGFAAPASENVTLTGGQLLTLNRNYVQLAQLKITLAPTSGQWRVDGGGWQSSATTVSNLSIGSHTVDYAVLAGHTAPASETVSLTAGQLLSLNRSYVPLAQLTITLSPSTGQWRVDSGAWLASGATATNLSAGTHAVTYSSLTGWAGPADETVSLAAGQSLSFARSYTQLVPVSITLTPATGQWRLNGGAWQASGASLSVLPGAYTVDYSALALYDSPASETFTLVAGGGLITARSYLSQKPSLTINLSAGGQWRVDGGAWQNSGARLAELAVGDHNVEYSDLGGVFDPPPVETVTLALRQNLILDRSYTLKPSALQVTLSAEGATWRAYQNEYSSGWRQSGETISDLRYSNYNIEYSYVSNHVTPATENVSVAPGETLSIDRTYVELASFSVSLSPSSGRWRIDGGQWRSSSVVLSDLSLGNHTIDFSSPLGYLPLPSETVTLVAGANPTLTRTFLQFASLTVSLTPASAKWRLDGGSWEDSSLTIGGLTVGNHTLEFSDVPGYVTPVAETVTLMSGANPAITRSYVQNPSLSVVLNPTSAQWRLDGVGPWQNSSATLIDLAPGAHTLEFSNVFGYSTPPSETVTLAIGAPVTLSRSYPPLATFAATLTPGSALWRIDGGPWRPSSTSVSNLSIGSHTVDFSDVSGYVTPAPETIVLVSGVNPTISRSYPLLAALSVSLNPSSARWRIDGGAWQNSGTSALNLLLGNHLIEYSDVFGYITPASETVTLVSGNNPPVSRSYTQLAIFGVNLNPSSAQWRIDGGAWLNSSSHLDTLSLGVHTVEFSDVPGYVKPPAETVTLVSGLNPPLTRSYTPPATFGVVLNPSSAQWRIDGGIWYNSSVGVTNLVVGAHTVEFSPLPGYVTPAPATVTLVSGVNPPLNYSYTPLASFSVSLNPMDAFWRIDAGEWQSSGTILQNLSLGSHTVEFLPRVGYIAPATETVSLSSGTNPTLTRSYTQLASFGVSLNPIDAFWRLDDGEWQSSGTILQNLSLGSHTVEFLPRVGYITPGTETVTLYSGNNPTLARSYTQLASFGVSLNPVDAFWRLDDGEWQSSGTILQNLSLGSHTVEFLPRVGYITPGTETVTLYSGNNPTLTRSYTRLASFSVSLNPADAFWRLDAGEWQSSGTILQNLSLGNHTVEFQPRVGYVTPATETVTLYSGSNPALTRSYPQLASLTVSLSETNAQWRLDGGSWQNNSTTLYGLSLGTHTIEFSSVVGYQTPSAMTITLVGGANFVSSPTYAAVASFSVYYSQAPYGQWRIDNGPWQNSSDTLSNLALGSHTVEFANVLGYITPAPVTVNLVGGYNSLSAPAYVQLASFYVYYSQTPYGQWRIDGGPWRNSSDMLNNLSLGTHLIEFADVLGYITPASRTVTLGSGYNSLSAPTYVQLASFYVYYSQAPYGQWRIDGGPWRNSSDMLNNLPLGSHLIEFADVLGYITPTSRTVTLGSGYNSLSAPTYVQLASFYVYYSQAPYGQWRIDGGPWRNSADMLNNLSLGSHLIEFADVLGYITPTSRTVTLGSGYNSLSAPSYVQLASFYVYYNQPPYGQWRIDGGVWRNSSDMLNNLSLGTHLIEFADVLGYITPAPVTITLSSGYNSLSAPAYVELASFYVYYNQAPYGPWRIDGGVWRNSSDMLNNLSLGSHFIEFADVVGYNPPAPVTLNLFSGYNSLAAPAYTPLATVPGN